MVAGVPACMPNFFEGECQTRFVEGIDNERSLMRSAIRPWPEAARSSRWKFAGPAVTTPTDNLAGILGGKQQGLRDYYVSWAGIL